MGCSSSKLAPAPADQRLERAASAPELDGFTLTGVTLPVLRRLRESALEKRAAPGPPSDKRTALEPAVGSRGKVIFAPRNAGEPLTTADVCFEVVKPATAARKCSYAELDAAPGESGPATAFVSHAWLYPFEWVVSALEAADLPADTLFWMDVAVVNQHTNATRGFEWWSSTFRQAVKTIGRTLLVLAPWRAPLPLGRAWCIWEIFCTVDTETELRVLLPAAERAAFATALVEDFDSIVKVVCAVDVEKAEAHDPADRDNIFAAVRGTCGFHALNVAAAGGLRGALALAVHRVLVCTMPLYLK